MGSTRGIEFLLLAQNLHEALGHVVGLLLGAVVPFAVLQEAQEQRIHRNRVHAEEHRCDHVRPDKHQDRRNERIVQRLGWSAIEERISHGRHSTGNQQLRQEKQEPSYLVQRDHPQDVPGQQTERILGTGAEILSVDCTHDVRVGVQELEEALQTPEAALAHAQHRLHHSVVVLSKLVIDVLQAGPDDLTDGDDQRTERKRSQVVANRA